jgi:hypothetical protein
MLLLPRSTGALVLGLAGCLFMPRSLSAETLSFAVAADTGIREFSPTIAFGGNQVVIAGTTGPLSGSTHNRGLFRFDLSTIPSQAVISDVRVTFGVVRVPPSQVDADFGLYPILQSWAEGSATWNNPGSTWHGAGGVAGLDYATASSATRAIDPVLGNYTFASTAGLTSDVQAWVNNPAANFGWMLLTDQEGVDFTARQFGAREGGAAAMLEVTFSVPEPSVFSLSLGGLALAGYCRSQRRSKPTQP